MNGLNKKTMVALSMMLPVAAMAEIRPIDDLELGEVTGQAGISIELETKVDIGEVLYTDTPSVAGSANMIGGGSLSMKNVSIGGANKNSFLGITSWGVTPSDKLDNILINIDLASDGDAVINLGPQNFGVIDFAVGIGSVELQGTGGTTSLMSNFNMVGLMGAASLIVDTADDSLNVVASLAIDDLDFDSEFLSLGVRDLQVTGTTFNPLAPQQLRAFFDVDFKVYSKANTRSAGGEALAVDFNPIEMDVRIGSIELGGASIGSVFVDDLVISQTRMEVYGH
ncbi:DUF6160 family protein [Alkalimarinus sediminis]|uniref:DUF6160 family protein n=1 Tax=Alkalimarinus sediminis TaxID=1632866 RepID=A0A9E8HJW7_9ALTE|nr:DUF6160 family protein [Alkalimarinus sediminis]UZW76033.1 DUF6160 family protein [Alkalimarinus sediminis]